MITAALIFTALALQAPASPAVLPPAPPALWEASCLVQVLDGDTIYGGSGTVIEEAPGRRPLVLTCAHVVASRPGSRVRVVLPDGRAFPGRIVSQDQWRDLAAISINPIPGLVPIKLAKQPPDLGEVCWQIGYPAGRLEGKQGPFCEIGLIGESSPRRALCPVQRFHIGTESGGSGSGIFRSDGTLAGVVWGSVSGKSHATPLAEVRDFLAGKPRP